VGIAYANNATTEGMVKQQSDMSSVLSGIFNQNKHLTYRSGV